MTTQTPTRHRIANAVRAVGRRNVKVLGHFRVRLILAAIVCVAAIGVVSGLAFAHSSTSAIGTGVVVIDTKLGYQSGAAAGTGIVLTSSGEVLTNNHVIQGATSVEVVVPGSTQRYSAKVVGYDQSADVAVLQLSGASNLKTASLGDSSKVTTGQVVKALGNAGGTGTLTAASGTVTSVGRSITVSEDQGGSAQLTGLIETDAALQPGDSGGPLLNTVGQVIGMDTAASSGFAFQAAGASDSYAIPIDTALTVANQIGSGSYGGPAPAAGLIAGIVAGGPAASAGLTTGDVIAAIDGRTISSPSTITSLLFTKAPGAKITVTYTDQSGTSHGTTVTLGSGPPQ